jgi:hypothetical protein
MFGVAKISAGGFGSVGVGAGCPASVVSSLGLASSWPSRSTAVGGRAVGLAGQGQRSSAAISIGSVVATC